MTNAELAPVIAVVGCDGSGKSTVSQHLLTWVARYGPAAFAHLGKQSGNVGRALARWPLVGPAIGRVIRRKEDKVHKSFGKDGKTVPGLPEALVVTVFTLRRLHRFRHMLKLRRQGFIVVTDRYPQVVIPGAYDGPGLPLTSQGGGLLHWLAKREHAKFAWMASYPPDLVLRLNVDFATALARKPDHRPETLRYRIEVTPRLAFNGAPIVDIDSAQPLPVVLAAAEAAVARVMAERGYRER